MAHTWWHKTQPVKPWILDPSGKYGAKFDSWGTDDYGHICPKGSTYGEITEHSMTAGQHALYQQDMADWKEMKNLQDQRQAMFQEMAQTTGPTPAPYTSSAGKREAGDPFSPIQVAGGPPPSDVMARFGRPKKWPYLQSIVNMGQLA